MPDQLPVREIVERLVSYRDGVQSREVRELIAEAANRLLIQESELRKRAASFSANEGARP